MIWGWRSGGQLFTNPKNRRRWWGQLIIKLKIGWRCMKVGTLVRTDEGAWGFKATTFIGLLLFQIRWRCIAIGTFQCRSAQRSGSPLDCLLKFGQGALKLAPFKEGCNSTIWPIRYISGFLLNKPRSVYSYMHVHLHKLFVVKKYTQTSSFAQDMKHWGHV